MQTRASRKQAELLTPEHIARLLPSSPVLSSDGRGWKGVVLQHYKHPPGRIDIPAVRDNILVVNLAGATLVEEELQGGQRQRRWTDAGHISLTPAGEPVSRVLQGRPDILLVHIAPALVDDVAEAMYNVGPGRASLHRRLAVPDERVLRFGQIMLDEAELADPGAGMVVEMVAPLLVVHLLRLHSNMSRQAEERKLPVKQGRLRRVIDYMESHLQEALPLAALAKTSGLSQPQFTRAFREATGEPPHRYLVGLRINRARDLLETTDLSVIEIGLRCGFEQPNHFATMFGKTTGMSPRTWRTSRRSI